MILRVSPPRLVTSSWWTILMTCWAGRQARRQVGADALLADAADEVLDDLEVDVGLEQGDADLPQDLVDLALAQPAAALELAEDALEAVGQSDSNMPGPGYLVGRAGPPTVLRGRAAVRSARQSSPSSRTRTSTRSWRRPSVSSSSTSAAIPDRAAAERVA